LINVFPQKLAYLFLTTILVFGACSSPSNSDEDDPGRDDPKQEIPDTDAVPADATLETVTWNLEWYGSNFSGPADPVQQTKNIIQVVDSLNADLFAFQEVHEQEDLDSLVKHMKDYRGFIAEHVNQTQKMAFVYNTNSIDSLKAGAITDVREAYQPEWDYYWANGRIPMFFEFNYTFEGNTEKFYAVVIHGKANTGDNDAEYRESYDRRKKAAEGLYYYLKDEKPDANIIVLGDYNDDVDESIYYDNQGNHEQTPYYQFVNDSNNFEVLSKKLSDSGESASVNDNYDDIIDHITISNELFDNYVQNSTAVYKAPQDYIDNYGNTTSDHLPVWAKFDVTKAKMLAKEE